MSPADHSNVLSVAPAPTTPYARIPARVRGLARQRWLRRGGGVLLGAAVLGVAAWWSGALDRLLGAAVRDENVYVVRPVDLSITLTENGELKPCNSVDIKCELDGFQNTIIYVIEESSKVKKGDLLVEFASDKLREDILNEEASLSRIQSELEAARQEYAIQTDKNKSDIEKAESDVQIARLELDKYEKGDFQQKLTAAELDIKQAEADILIKTDELAKSARLREKGYVTMTRLRELEFELLRAQMTLEKNKLARDTLLSYERPRELTAKQTALTQATQELERVRARAESLDKQAAAKVRDAESRLALSQARLERLKGELEKCKIFSPADGVVQYAGGGERNWRDENRIAPGQTVWKGQTLLQLPDTSQMVVTTRIHEADRHQVEIGQPCIVRVPAVPGQTFTGKLVKMAQYADSANRWMNPDLKEHAAEILLDDTNAPVSPGDTAEVRLLVGELQNVIAVPVICVYPRGMKNFVFRKSGAQARPVEVRLGRSNTTMVEVVEGLSPGDRVLMQAGDDLLAMLPKEEVKDTPAEEEDEQVRGPQRAAAAAPRPQAPEAARAGGDRGRGAEGERGRGGGGGRPGRRGG